MLTLRPRIGGGISFAIFSTSPYGMFKRPADVFDRRTRCHRSKGDDLANRFAPVKLGNVIDHVAAAADAEIDIDIGHRDAFGIEKPLEQQIILQRIDVGDPHAIRGERTGGRTAARADRNALLVGILDEVPDDQESSRGIPSS